VLAGNVINAITGKVPDAGRHVIRIALLIAGWRSSTPAHSSGSGSTPRASARASSTTCAPGCTTTCSGMPLQFFTRTQTGALVSRLNNDVMGAQQAFTSTLSGTVGNVIALLLTRRRDVHAVLAGHPAVAGAGAGVHAAAGWSGAGSPRSPGSRTSSTRR
jgi:ATP-binding cassette subfamily B protein